MEGIDVGFVAEVSPWSNTSAASGSPQRVDATLRSCFDLGGLRCIKSSNLTYTGCQCTSPKIRCSALLNIGKVAIHQHEDDSAHHKWKGCCRGETFVQTSYSRLETDHRELTSEGDETGWNEWYLLIANCPRLASRKQIMNQSRRTLWQAVSNAAEVSSSTMTVTYFWSTAVYKRCNSTTRGMLSQ